MSGKYSIYQKVCLEWLQENQYVSVNLTFVDPPFNQGKA